MISVDCLIMNTVHNKKKPFRDQRKSVSDGAIRNSCLDSGTTIESGKEAKCCAAT